jgi:hypothetical protein
LWIEDLDEQRGVRGEYAWIATDSTTAMLAEAVPELFVGRILVAVAIDCGPYRLGAAQKLAGWVTHAGHLGPHPGPDETGWLRPTLASSIAVSPTIKSLSKIRGFLEATCSKECYMLAPGTKIAPECWATIEMFSNLIGTLAAVPAWFCTEADAEGDEGLRYYYRKVERFWKQMEVLRAESYVCDRDTCVLVSRDVRLLDRVASVVQRG